MIARTQIGGKYDQADLSLFDLRQRMRTADIDVRYPASDGIVSTVNGRGYTFDPRATSFFEVETDYYRSIANSDFHTVNNRFLHTLGYIGASAALEVIYAMLHNRPILLMHQPDFAPSVDEFCADTIQVHSSLLHVQDLTTMDASDIADIARALKAQQVNYGLSEQVGSVVMSRVDKLFDDIQNQGLGA